jgi:hypothetical protein
VLTEIGSVQIEVPRDTDASFSPQIVRKGQRRLTGVDDIVLSLSAKGLTTGEIAAHFDDVYGAAVSKDTISQITDFCSPPPVSGSKRERPLPDGQAAGSPVHHAQFVARPGRAGAGDGESVEAVGLHLQRLPHRDGIGLGRSDLQNHKAVACTGTEIGPACGALQVVPVQHRAVTSWTRTRCRRGCAPPRSSPSG